MPRRQAARALIAREFAPPCAARDLVTTRYGLDGAAAAEAIREAVRSGAVRARLVRNRRYVAVEDPSQLRVCFDPTAPDEGEENVLRICVPDEGEETVLRICAPDEGAGVTLEVSLLGLHAHLDALGARPLSVGDNPGGRPPHRLRQEMAAVGCAWLIEHGVPRPDEAGTFARAVLDRLADRGQADEISERTVERWAAQFLRGVHEEMRASAAKSGFCRN